jgi:hypothetical protein
MGDLKNEIVFLFFRPIASDQLSLFKNSAGGFFLHIRRVTIYFPTIGQLV